MSRWKFIFLTALSAGIAICGVIWVLHAFAIVQWPMSSKPRLVSNMTDRREMKRQELRERYPYSLLGPWFNDERNWRRAEMATRSAIVIACLIGVIFYGRSISRDQRTGVVPRLSLTRQGIVVCTVLFIPQAIIITVWILVKRLHW